MPSATADVFFTLSPAPTPGRWFMAYTVDGSSLVHHVYRDGVSFRAAWLDWVLAAKSETAAEMAAEVEPPSELEYRSAAAAAARQRLGVVAKRAAGPKRRPPSRERGIGPEIIEEGSASATAAESSMDAITSEMGSMAVSASVTSSGPMGLARALAAEAMNSTLKSSAGPGPRRLASSASVPTFGNNRSG